MKSNSSTQLSSTSDLQKDVSDSLMEQIKAFLKSVNCKKRSKEEYLIFASLLVKLERTGALWRLDTWVIFLKPPKETKTGLKNRDIEDKITAFDWGEGDYFLFELARVKRVASIHARKHVCTFANPEKKIGYLLAKSFLNNQNSWFQNLLSLLIKPTINCPKGCGHIGNIKIESLNFNYFV